MKSHQRAANVERPHGHVRSSGSRAAVYIGCAVNARETRPTRERTLSTEAVGGLVAFLDSSGLDRRRYSAAIRLRNIRDSDQFDTLPEDLRERIREILADS